ncbi:hypothetical protein BD779DRAFT_1477566 [Infundibulicybe gibba]|nr:hypothetical protein BD779DRAFT_1477566 [Infundibulicybe gibba]
MKYLTILSALFASQAMGAVVRDTPVSCPSSFSLHALSSIVVATVNLPAQVTLSAVPSVPTARPAVAYSALYFLFRVPRAYAQPAATASLVVLLLDSKGLKTPEGELTTTRPKRKEYHERYSTRLNRHGNSCSDCLNRLFLCASHLWLPTAARLAVFDEQSHKSIRLSLVHGLTTGALGLEPPRECRECGLVANRYTQRLHREWSCLLIKLQTGCSRCSYAPCTGQRGDNIAGMNGTKRAIFSKLNTRVESSPPARTQGIALRVVASMICGLACGCNPALVFCCSGVQVVIILLARAMCKATRHENSGHLEIVPTLKMKYFAVLSAFLVSQAMRAEAQTSCTLSLTFYLLNAIPVVTVPGNCKSKSSVDETFYPAQARMALRAALPIPAAQPARYHGYAWRNVMASPLSASLGGVKRLLACYSNLG